MDVSLETPSPLIEMSHTVFDSAEVPDAYLAVHSKSSLKTFEVRPGLNIMILKTFSG
jgi:hypothetical protein